MQTILINTKSTIQSIFSNNPDGVNREYLLVPNSRKRLDLLIRFSSYLIELGHEVFIESKFQSKYTDRHKRLEVVSRNNGNYNIYKFSSFSRFDKDAIEISRTTNEVANSLISSEPICILPVIILSLDEDSDFVRESLRSMLLNVEVLQF